MIEFIVDVQIEIPKGSNVKYEYDHTTHTLLVDRILQSPVCYFFNYGFIHNTLAPDGDPLDAVVLCEQSLFPTSKIKCKIIGVIFTEDEKGIDHKIILVPCNDVDMESIHINNVNDLSICTKNKLICFFKDYKKMEKNKFVIVQDTIGNKDDAIKVYNDCNL